MAGGVLAVADGLHPGFGLFSTRHPHGVGEEPGAVDVPFGLGLVSDGDVNVGWTVGQWGRLRLFGGGRAVRGDDSGVGRPYGGGIAGTLQKERPNRFSKRSRRRRLTSSRVPVVSTTT